MKTLQQEFPSAKHRPSSENQTNAVYRIPCQSCPWSYIGETGRSLKTRKSEHVRNVKNHNTGSNVAKQHGLMTTGLTLKTRKSSIREILGPGKL